MASEYNVLAPGPVNLHPKVRESLAWPMIHHRTPEFDKILKQVLTRLKKVFQTEQDCFLLSGTGSAGMEALLVNTLAPGDEILGIDSGKFGERWCEMAKVYGGKLTVLKTEWGKAVDPEAVRTHLKNHPQTKIVMTQACETSTGVLHDIQAIGSIVAEHPECLFLVDGITALGAVNLPMDAWKIDGLVGGSQKAFMLPTGLTLFSFSQKAWKKIEKNQQPRFYFDIRKERSANQKGETFFSSNVTLIRALNVVLDLIEEKGLTALFQEIESRAQFVRKYALKMGFCLYATRPSPSLTALVVPAGVDSQTLRLRLEENHATTIMGGQDQAKGKIIRIGHMGYITPAQQLQLMVNLCWELEKLTGKVFPSEQKTAWESEMRRDLGL
ncbi:MAG: pyridoxal-phosphate-dependent aminotransferase family protein [Pseudobdellovibrionaceae bacterium]